MREPQNSLQALKALREAFDLSFASGPGSPPTDAEPLVAIHAGGQSCAIRLAEILELARNKKVSRLPGASGRVGLAAFRGRAVAVYSLAPFVGGADGQEPGRWLALVRDAALSFDSLDSFNRIRRSEFLASPPAAPAESLKEAVRIDGRLRWVVSIPLVLRAIEKESRTSLQGEE